jgi:hypothetical protein
MNFFFFHAPGDHTADNLHEYFVKVFAEYGITDKIVCGTTDNGSNYVAAMGLHPAWTHFRCLVHTLQLAVTKALGVRLLSFVFFCHTLLPCRNLGR